ncbi:protein phosphatase 2C domain-containing protein [Streptomyces sp. NPDC018031]|uniref:protein phosphatase 2C domain-containing protein n=1 Tax=Streptomyces sp. NPDC018031 TaxID=3365033 RepID=UPI0037B2DAC8
MGDRPPTYEPEPTALPLADPAGLRTLVPDTVLDGARYGPLTLRAASLRGDSARFRGEPRRDALLTARFGAGESALLLVAVATGLRAAEGAHRAAHEVCEWIGGAVGRSQARLAADLRAGSRAALRSGLHRLTARSLGRLRTRAAELGLDPDTYTASLRCLLLPADPACRTRVFFGAGAGGLFRLRDGAWQDLEPPVREPREPGEPRGTWEPKTPGTADRAEPDAAAAATSGGPAAGAADGRPADPDGAGHPAGGPAGDGPPDLDPFRFRASVARPGDTLLLCSPGLAEPLRGEPALARALGERWAGAEPPGLAGFLADAQTRVKGYADDRTAAAVWEA